MPTKIPRGLVALSSSAIATIYFAGLFSTRAAADGISAVASADQPATSTPSSGTAVQTSAPTVVVGASATTTPTPQATATATAQPIATSTSTSTTTSTATKTSGYADGTYSGTGSGRFGSVTVSLTTSGGTISNVQVTKVSTTFPVSQIASLPAQVVQKQSANVNAISGATASSQAFKQAIQQALAQATAANSTTGSASS